MLKFKETRTRSGGSAMSIQLQPVSLCRVNLAGNCIGQPFVVLQQIQLPDYHGGLDIVC